MAKTTAQDSNEKQGQREMKWAQASNEKQGQGEMKWLRHQPRLEMKNRAGEK